MKAETEKNTNESVLIRVPQELLGKIDELATKEQRTRNNLIVKLLNEVMQNKK